MPNKSSFAFVFREVQAPLSVLDCRLRKRKKPGTWCGEVEAETNWHWRASQGPISLDDFRSLQKSNKELRKLLDEQVATVASLLCETRAATEKHETEMRELKESVSNSLDQLTELNQSLVDKDKELAELKMSVQGVQAEAAVELKLVVDGALKREKGQEEIINELQEAEKERSFLVETLKTKLEDTGQQLVKSDNKVCKLEEQFREEHLAFVSDRKRIEELEHARKRLSEQLECEKAAREEAWAKVSALELEISVAMRDFDSERLRLNAAR